MERKQKKEEQQRFVSLDVSELQDLVEGAQAKATEYAVNVFQVFFFFFFWNLITTTSNS